MIQKPTQKSPSKQNTKHQRSRAESQTSDNKNEHVKTSAENTKDHSKQTNNDHSPKAKKLGSEIEKEMKMYENFSDKKTLNLSSQQGQSFIAIGS